MSDTIITAVATLIAAVIAAVIGALVTARSQAKMAITDTTDRIAESAAAALDAVLTIPEELRTKAARAEVAPHLPGETGLIDHAKLESLRVFVLTYRTKIEILEAFGCAVSAHFYYSFAVYYAYVEQDFHAAQYFIRKAQDAAVDDDLLDPIPILRWAARISRLNRNEQTACALLTKIIEVLENPQFAFREDYDARARAALLRSRGFTYFNRDMYEAAMADFRASLELADIKHDRKLPYCELGIAMSLLRSLPVLDGTARADVLRHYAAACRMEPYFAATSRVEMTRNLGILEGEKAYYFSELEKTTIDAVRTLAAAE